MAIQQTCDRCGKAGEEVGAVTLRAHARGGMEMGGETVVVAVTFEVGAGRHAELCAGCREALVRSALEAVRTERLARDAAPEPVKGDEVPA